MRLCIIGVGQAGGRIADLFNYYRTWKWSTHGYVAPVCLAVNTAKSDLMGLKAIPTKKRILIGQTWVKGHGVGTNNELGAKIMQEEMHNVERALSALRKHHIDAFLVIAGLGGGTGSGGAPVLVKYLKGNHEEPVYALGVLPARDEGRLMAFNAARSLIALEDAADSLIIFDNESWKRDGASISKSYFHMNLTIVKPFGYLLGAGEPKSESKIGVKVVDAGDVTNTLGGFSVLGYAERKVKRDHNPLNNKSNSMERLDKSTLCYSVVKNAASPENLTAKCDVRDAEKALMIVSGPPKQLDREGIEMARKFLEDSVWGTEVRVGDYPVRRSKKIVGTVLLSGIINIPRVKEILEGGAAVQEEIEGKPKRRMDLDIEKYRKILRPLVDTKKK